MMAAAGPAAALGKPALRSRLSQHYSDCVAAWPGPQQLPIVYSESYNITLFGIERLHPFDTCKFKKVVDGLTHRGVIRDPHTQLVTPLPAPDSLLLDVHTPEYLQALHSSSRKVAEVVELAAVAAVPIPLVRAKLLTPMRTHTAGTVLAAALAVERGWAVNVGGGLHHAHSSGGSGWCPYDDIYLAVRRLRVATDGAVRRVLVIDLDAHQGNGVERDRLKWGDDDIFIVDAFNASAFPRDTEAKRGIDVALEFPAGTGDEEYLQALRAGLKAAAERFPNPDLVIFNAGTDVLAGDPVGRLGMSPSGVIERDALVWAFALQHAHAPLLMLLSGGYTKASAGVIIDSLDGVLRRHAGLGGEGQAAAAVVGT